MVPSDQEKIKVLMFPWLAHGHISPFLELAKRLADRNFLIHICSTPVNLSSIKNKIPQNYSRSIRLVELHLPSSPELPPHYHTTNGLPLNLHTALRNALRVAKPDFSDLIKSIKPDLLMHDIIIPWAGAVAYKHRIPSAAFFTSGATMLSYFAHLGIRPGVEFPFPEVRLTEFELSMARKTSDSAQDEYKETDPDDVVPEREDRFMVINSSREIEGKYIDYASQLIHSEIIPVGTQVQSSRTEGGVNDAEIMDWLGKKDEYSSVFVSFGSEYFLEKETIQEIAYGLELSNVNFIWIVRFTKGADVRIEDVLPEGFLERVGERGKILEKWAPQAKILRHPSIGGFVSHCGWNSVIESIQFGVPIIAMPMHLDQPMNAKLVVELGVAVEVKRDVKGKIQKEEISTVIKDVIHGGEGESLRRKISEQRENIRSRSGVEMEVVVQKLAEVCGKSI